MYEFIPQYNPSCYKAGLIFLPGLGKDQNVSGSFQTVVEEPTPFTQNKAHRLLQNT
jgi:hypothetical protein